MTEERFFQLVKELGDSLLDAARVFDEDSDPYAQNVEAQRMNDAMQLTGDLIQDWAQSKMNGEF